MAHNQMIINYVPGDECRVALVRDGLLEEFYAERMNAVGHVGNIYVGKVVNVEPAIQAAFVDFGLEQNGFLHITDLHPQYFPGEKDSTERVGMKTPRRSRPPIQAALKRGQEITVQVIKEGIGTKGPTLTSYISIPGRFLVMMPDMDRVGVSRKVEDEDQRREMRKALDQLDLPEGFGFILRTAGMDRNKTDLKRDLAYLQRLWQDMERRRKSGNKPRLLYAESDLLVRALRDLLTGEVDDVVIDNISAIRRAGRFMKIVAPRSGAKLLHYDQPAPIYHAFGIEEQIRGIHRREAPLPSGGSLVIDETEAMVAIDVNSGKMRSHGDAETTAYKTDMEAADEICRQLRLRDLGGLVVLDMIDMRSRSHKREVETRFKNNLKRDRARTKMLPISQFGMIELTRQRMRGSHRSAHFADCPMCVGSGMVQRPDSVAADAMRDLACLVQHDVVRHVEMVVSPRVAGELLSAKRKALGALERRTGKRIDVRVSETIPVDRVTYYAYDERGADIDVPKLTPPKTPRSLPVWEDETALDDQWAVDPGEQDESAPDEEEIEPVVDEREGEDFWLGLDADTIEAGTREEAAGKKRRRRRGRRRKGEDREQQPEAAMAPEKGREGGRKAETADADASGEEGGGRKKRRRRRRRRGGNGVEGAPGADAERGEGAEASDESAAGDERSKAVDASGASGAPGAPEGDESGDGAGRKKRRRRRRRRGGGVGGEPQSNGQAAGEEAEEAPVAPRPAVVGGYAPRGDSWDLEPAAVTPAPRTHTSMDEPVAKEPAEEPEDDAGQAAVAALDQEEDEALEQDAADTEAEPAKAPAASRRRPAKKKASSRKKAAKASAKKAPSKRPRKKKAGGESAGAAE